jgi:hypothetical protein
LEGLWTFEESLQYYCFIKDTNFGFPRIYLVVISLVYGLLLQKICFPGNGKKHLLYEYSLLRIKYSKLTKLRGSPVPLPINFTVLDNVYILIGSTYSIKESH